MSKRKGPWRSLIVWPLTLAFLVTAIPVPLHALAPPTDFATTKGDSEADEDSFSVSFPIPRDRSLVKVDVPLISMVPEAFEHQVDFLWSCRKPTYPTIAWYQESLTLSGFLTSGVASQLSELASIERNVQREEVTKRVVHARENKRLMLAKRYLRMLLKYFPESLEGKKAWEDVDPRDYVRGATAYDAADPHGMVEAALHGLGWEITRVEGKARLKVIAERHPVAVTPTRVPKMVSPVAEASPEPSTTSALIRAIPILPTKKISDRAFHHQRMLGVEIRAMIRRGKYADALRLLTIGTETSEERREVARVLQNELGIALTAELLASIREAEAAALLANVARTWRRSRVPPFTEQVPVVHEEGVQWAADVLSYLDKYPGDDPLAPRIYRHIMLGAVIPAGPKIAEALMFRFWAQAEDDPDFGLGDQCHTYMEGYLGYELKILRDIEEAKRLKSLYARGIPGEKKIEASVTMTKDEEITEHLVGLLNRSIKRLDGPKGEAKAVVISDNDILQEAAQILFVKLEPLRAYRILRYIALEDAYTGLLDIDLVHLLSCVHPEATAAFFVEIYDASTDAQRLEAHFGNPSIYQSIVTQLVQLHHQGLAVHVLRAMLANKFLSQGGRELFRKILDPKTTHLRQLVDQEDREKVVFELYEALYDLVDDLVDPETFWQTGVLLGGELTLEQREARFTQWAPALFTRTAERGGLAEAERDVVRLVKLRDPRVIPSILAFVNQINDRRTPDEWGMSQVQLDTYSRGLLRVARDLDPEVFAWAYWSHEGERPELGTGWRRVLRGWRTLVGSPPVWSAEKMDRLMLQELNGDEQTDFILHGVRGGAYGRVAGFTESALINAPAAMDPRAVTAAAFIRSNEHLRDLLPLVRMRHERLAGLYRSRSVLRTFDAPPRWRDDEFTWQFQGEYIDVKIFLGTEVYRDFVDRLRQGFNYQSMLPEPIDSSSSRTRLLRGVTEDRFRILVGRIDRDPDGWRAIVQTQPGTPERIAACRTFLEPLIANSQTSHLLPLLADYLAITDVSSHDDILHCVSDVAIAIDRKPSETTLLLKETAEKYDALRVGIHPVDFAMKIVGLGINMAKGTFTIATVGAGATGLIGLLYASALNVGKALHLPLWHPEVLFGALFNLAVWALLAVVVNVATMHSILMLLLLAVIVAAGAVTAVVWPPLFLLVGGFFLLRYPYVRWIYLPSLERKMWRLLLEKEPQPGEDLHEQIPELLLRRAVPHQRALVDSLSKAGLEDLADEVEDLKTGSTPLDKFLLAYAQTRLRVNRALQESESTEPQLPDQDDLKPDILAPDILDPYDPIPDDLLSGEDLWGEAEDKTRDGRRDKRRDRKKIKPQMGKRGHLQGLSEEAAQVRGLHGQDHEVTLTQVTERIDAYLSLLNARGKLEALISAERRELLRSIIDSVAPPPEERKSEQIVPGLYTFSSRVEDFSGFASPEHAMIGVHDSLESNPIALFHEIGEYAQKSGALRLNMKNMSENTGVLHAFVGNQEFALTLQGEPLAIARKDSQNPHYLLRALQRELFSDADRELTLLVKEWEDVVAQRHRGQPTPRRERGGTSIGRCSLSENIIRAVAFRKGDKEIVFPPDILSGLRDMCRIGRALDVELHATVFVKDGVARELLTVRDPSQIAIAIPDPAKVDIRNNPRYYEEAADFVRELQSFVQSNPGKSVEQLQPDLRRRLMAAKRDLFERYGMVIVLITTSRKAYKVGASNLLELVESPDLLLVFLQDVMRVNYTASKWFSSVAIVVRGTEEVSRWIPRIEGILAEGEEIVDIHRHPTDSPSPPSTISPGGDIYSDGYFEGSPHGLILADGPADVLFITYEPDRSNLASYHAMFQKFWRQQRPIFEDFERVAMRPYYLDSFGDQPEIEGPSGRLRVSEPGGLVEQSL